MSNPRDLVQERRLIAARRTRRTAVTVEIAAWRDNHHPGDVVKGVQVRCDDCANGHPLIAKLYPTPSSLLFVARIRWRPVDQLTLPPWTKDRMLADADDLLVGDDRILGGWLDHLDAWTTGLQADGDRWLVAEPDFKLYDVIDRP
ncbi:MAG TPA: hypothetical protein VHV76_12715, partial [Mycobacteriales bacterium]|nr:hypothetical protein [Mycobacteriales bacterium]